MLKFLSRRMFLIAAGGGVSASLVWTCGGSRRSPVRTTQPAGVFERFDNYVDDSGWMLTADDKKIVRTNPV